MEQTCSVDKVLVAAVCASRFFFKTIYWYHSNESCDFWCFVLSRNINSAISGFRISSNIIRRSKIVRFQALKICKFSRNTVRFSGQFFLSISKRSSNHLYDSSSVFPDRWSGSFDVLSKDSVCVLSSIEFNIVEKIRPYPAIHSVKQPSTLKGTSDRCFRLFLMCSVRWFARNSSLRVFLSAGAMNVGCEFCNSIEEQILSEILHSNVRIPRCCQYHDRLSRYLLSSNASRRW